MLKNLEPSWVKAQLEAYCLPLIDEGGSLDYELLASRRGTVTGKVKSAKGSWLLKIAVRTDDSPADTESIHREYRILTEIQTLRRRFVPQLLIYNSQVALVENWIDGRGLVSNVQDLISSGDQNPVKKLLKQCLLDLHEIHEAGWSHGDIQPAHTIYKQDTEKIVFCDYGSAQSASFPLPGYKGGMVHFNAPEICADILKCGSAVATPAADIFSLAASFAFSITEKVIGNYQMTLPWEKKLQVLSRCDLKTDTLISALSTMPDVCKTLLQMLEKNPQKRIDLAKSAVNIL